MRSAAATASSRGRHLRLRRLFVKVRRSGQGKAVTGCSRSVVQHKGGNKLRKFALLGVVGIAAVAAFAGPAGAASGGGCQLQGSASFSPGLGATNQAFTYSFAGALSGCQSTVAGAPTSGAVESGKTVTRSYTDPTTGATHTVTYQEPVSTGSGGCSNSTTSGTGIVTWSDGTVTVLSYSTTGAAAAVSLSGSVAPSVTLNALDAQPGDPTTITISTTRYAGYSSQGALAFQPPDPTACTAPAGVTDAGISGFVGLGSSS